MGWWLVLGKYLPSVAYSPRLDEAGYSFTDSCANSILCSDFAIKRIDEPFVLETDDRNEWAL